jgi:hypothetical protein
MTALLGVILSTPLSPRAVAAGDEAKRHFDAAIALARRHDFAAAIAEFEASYQLHPLPELWLNIALSERALERWSPAAEHLRRYLSESEVRGSLSAEKRAEVKALIEEADAKAAGAQNEPTAGEPPRVEATPSSPAVPAPAGAPEPSSTPQKVTAPPPSRPNVPGSPRFTDAAQGRAAVGLGVSALALVVAGAATGGVVLAEKSEYHQSCDHVCDAGLYGRAHALAVTTDVLLSVGAAAAVTSVVLTLTRLGKLRQVRATRVVGFSPGSALQGAF